MGSGGRCWDNLYTIEGRGKGEEERSEPGEEKRRKVVICLVADLVFLVSRPFCRGGPRCRSPLARPLPNLGTLSASCVS